MAARVAAPTTTAAKRNGLSSGAFGRERVSEIQRARIFAAMVEVSAERGAADATVAHVVKRAGISRRTFYEIFADREECFLATLDDGILRATRAVLETYDPDAPWLERIRTGLTGFLSFLDGDRATGRLLLVDSFGAGVKARTLRSTVFAHAITVVDEGRAEDKRGVGLPTLTAEGVVGGVLSVLHSRLLDPKSAPLTGLTGQLMGTIVLPFLGPAVARKEIARPAPVTNPAATAGLNTDPLREIPMRLTYRTVRALTAIAAKPGSSNREIGHASEITDQGQISKLLARLERLGLVRNTETTTGKGAPNVWTLTEKGAQIERAISTETPQRPAR